jgi:hypothetical protein
MSTKLLGCNETAKRLQPSQSIDNIVHIIKTPDIKFQVAFSIPTKNRLSIDIDIKEGTNLFHMATQCLYGIYGY